MKTTALLFGQGDEEQTVRIEYFHEQASYPNIVEVYEVSILTPLSITPSDLYEDVGLAISKDLLREQGQVFIRCEIQEAVEKEMLFI